MHVVFALLDKPLKIKNRVLRVTQRGKKYGAVAQRNKKTCREHRDSSRMDSCGLVLLEDAASDTCWAVNVSGHELKAIVLEGVLPFVPLCASALASQY